MKSGQGREQCDHAPLRKRELMGEGPGWTDRPWLTSSSILCSSCDFRHLLPQKINMRTPARGVTVRLLNCARVWDQKLGDLHAPPWREGQLSWSCDSWWGQEGGVLSKCLRNKWAAHSDQGGQSSLPANEGHAPLGPQHIQNPIGIGWDDLAEMAKLLGCVHSPKMAVVFFVVVF